MAEPSTFRESSVDLTAPNCRPVLQEKAKLAGAACSRGDFRQAVDLYTQAIELDPNNHVLYGNRSAACIRILDFERALEDGKIAGKLQPLWPKAHYRQGVALQCLGRHAEALAAFSTALAHDDKSPQLLNTLLDAAMKSPLKETLKPICEHLKTMKLDRSPFVIISVIGQELLSIGHIAVAVGCLEAALKIDACGLRLRGSVISALSTAYWKLGNIIKAEEYMKQDLETSLSLGDKAGECRAHGNLGGAYYAQRNFEKALEHHRKQLDIAMKLKDRKSAALALSSLGHIYVADCDYSDALNSHKKASVMYKELEDRLSEARELGNVGAVHLLLGQYEEAIRCHQEHLDIAIELQDRTEEGKAYSDLGSAYHYKRDFDKAIHFHKLVLDIAKETEDFSMEARAYAGLGHAFRCKGDVDQCRAYHEKQLEVSVRSKDRATEGRALSNLGIIFQHQEQYQQALKLHKAHLAICKELDDRAGQGRAYGNMGCAYSALGRYDQAIKFHKQELLISREVNDRASEACTHGNLAVAYQATGALDKALKHYQRHLTVSIELKDRNNESIAVSNLGNFFSSCGEFENALPFYEKFLSITKHLRDKTGECKACQNLGFAHYSLGNYSEAISFYERNIALASDLDDRTSLARAYCNIGLAHSALGNYDRAMEFQQKFLKVSNETNDALGVIKAHGNIGDICMVLGDAEEGIENYKEQLRLAESMDDVNLLGDAYGKLGSSYRTVKEAGLALDCHQRELNARQQANDMLGIYRAFGNLGSNYLLMQQYEDAYKCFFEQLHIANQLGNGELELKVFGNLGFCRSNSGDYKEALGFFERQIASLEHMPEAYLDIGRVHGNLGECYHKLGNYAMAVQNFEKYLMAAQQAESGADQDKAYRGLGNAHRAMGDLQQALVCFEERLVIAHDLTDVSSKGAAYGELGNLHKTLGNYEKAIMCFEHQLALARESGDVGSEGEALSGLGQVNQKMGEYEKALKYHEKEVQIADQLNETKRRALAYHHLGTTYEVLGSHKQAVTYQEQYLKLAAQMGDQVAKCQAYISLGRTHHAIRSYSKAISFLQQGLTIAESLRRYEEEARIRHRLGLSLMANKQLDAAHDQLKLAAEILEDIRRDVVSNGEFKISLYELQAACYQVLQRVLVTMGRHVEALAVAERARTRGFVDLLLERQVGTNSRTDVLNPLENAFKTEEHIMDFVRSQKASILYYSIAAGHLYSWLLNPKEGLVKFCDNIVADGDTDDTLLDLEQSINGDYSHTATLLDSFITHVRDALGVEPHLNLQRSSSTTENDFEETWDQENILELSSIRSYLSTDEDDDAMSITSIPGRPGSFSTPRSKYRNIKGSLGKLNGVRSGGKKHGRSSKPPLRALYDLLISSMEESFPPESTFENDGSELVLVIQGDLYLVPFAVLRGSLSKEPLFRRFRLSVVPSLQALRSSNEAANKHSSIKIDPSSVLIVGNPNVPATFGQWASNPNAEHEAKIVAELFKTSPLLGAEATKNEVIDKLPKSQCIHFATHVSWKLAAVILSPSSSGKKLGSSPSSPNSEGLELLEESDDAPPLSDFLLTAADILNLKLSTKLVVVGAAYSHSSKNRITSDGLIGLTRAFLAAGVQSLLVALWPVPDLACKLLLKAFYGALLRGMKASHALSQAMHVVQKTKQFSHPSNWAGFVLIGGDSTLTNKEVKMSDAFALLLNNPKYYREAMKVLVHLVDKAMQRLRHGQRSSMYTAEASINAKVKGVNGWRELLSTCGFRFQKAKNGIPDSVFFPSSSTQFSERLSLASNHLHAFLGLSPATLQALAMLAHEHDVGLALINLFNEVLSCFFNNMANVQVPLKLKLWRTLGCHDLLASLGFDLVGVGKQEVMLRSGKANSRRALQCTVQALCALTDTVNPADVEEPAFNLVGKAHSSSIAMSNISFVSASLGSDLDMRTKSAEDLNIMNRERRGTSPHSRTSAVVRPRRHSSSTEALMRSLADLEAESSVDPETPEDAVVTPTQPRPIEDRPANQNFRGSQPIVANVNRKSSQRSVSSIDVSDLRVSPVDMLPSPPAQTENHSDSSDVDSYSDIMEQQRRDTKKDKKGSQTSLGANGVSSRKGGFILRKTHSSSSSEFSVGKQEDNTKTPGSISSLRPRQKIQDSNENHFIQHNSINRTTNDRPSKPLHSYTRNSTANLHEVQRIPYETPVMNHHDHIPVKYRSEGNLSSYKPGIIKEPTTNGLLSTLDKNDTRLTNGDVKRSNNPVYSKKPPNRDHMTPTNSHVLNGGYHPRGARDDFSERRQSMIDLSSDDEFYSQHSYASHLRNISSSNEYLPRLTPPKRGINQVIATRVVNDSNLDGRVRNHKSKDTRQGLRVQVSNNSYSSQDSTSTESPTTRQIAAEEAATALMQNHVGSGLSRGSSSASTLTRENLAMKEFEENSTKHTKLEQGHIANLAHLQSSSC
ncbi:tetratricopeptide repeat protein 28-like [Actinia tenebrosa]|uniref:Tetratricopeptide repeat protein 28-like n=1 Tax=Actinia tenebrosa TaxID=6105 RepID=A0A6P8J087_ACTTE|nr:tetratricopeptide repeat protein 28-like [Actinia tenebrosa]